MGRKLNVARARLPKHAAELGEPAVKDNSHAERARSEQSDPAIPPITNPLGAATLPDIKRARNFSASDAKTKLGEVIDFVAAGGVATITRRGRQRFAVMQLETVEALVNIVSDYQLASLGERYDALIATMQTRESKSAIDSLFSASPEEIGAAAAASNAGVSRIGAAAKKLTSKPRRASAKSAPR